MAATGIAAGSCSSGLPGPAENAGCPCSMIIWCLNLPYLVFRKLDMHRESRHWFLGDKLPCILIVLIFSFFILRDGGRPLLHPHIPNKTSGPKPFMVSVVSKKPRENSYECCLCCCFDLEVHLDEEACQ